MLTATDADDQWYEEWRRRELPRLDTHGVHYLDYTGAALAPASLVRAETERLLDAVHGNPHSLHAASRRSSDDLATARAAILQLLGADPSVYEVVLTANASAACRLVGEGWRWGAHSPLVLSRDNHNSVMGLREFARRAAAPVHLLPLDAGLRLDDLSAISTTSGGVVAFPAQSNFSGVRHPLSLVPLAQSHGHAVVLDAAALLHGGCLDLSAVQPEFVVLSHYKIAGYPTGLGALVARRDALPRLQRPWFAGGTVEWVSLAHDAHLLRAGAEGFEDGTPSFLAAGAVPAALELVRRDGGERLVRQLGALTGMLLDGLAALRHRSGAPMVTCYGPSTTIQRGATIACNLLRPDGSVVPHWDVEARATQAGVALRGGCFCNPGCAEAAFGWPHEVAGQALAALGAAFTVERFAAALPGRAVGAVRLSLGLGSVRRDVARALDTLEEIAAAA